MLSHGNTNKEKSEALTCVEMEAATPINSEVQVPGELSYRIGADTQPQCCKRVVESDSEDGLQSIIPAKGSTMPAKAGIIPAEGSIIPAEGSVILAEGSVILAERDVIPAKGDVIPAKGSAIPAEGRVIPAKAGIQAGRGRGHRPVGPSLWIPASAGMTSRNISDNPTLPLNLTYRDIPQQPSP